MKLYRQYIFLFLLIFTYQQKSSDLSNCMAANKNSCKSVSISDKNFECCEILTDYYGNSYLSDMDLKMCYIFTTQKMTKDLIESTERTYREAYGFVSTLYGYDASYLSSYSISFKQTYNCPSQSFTIDYNVGTFTNEEKEIFKKDNYCLRLYYQGLMDMDLLPEGTLNLQKKSITKSDCSNAVILPSSKNAATCAYASFEFKLYDGSIKTLTTCLYISKSSFDTKTLDQHLDSNFKSFTTVDGVSIKSYEIEITDKDGNSLKYDSISKTLTSNKGQLIGISKIISLILMVCLL